MTVLQRIAELFETSAPQQPPCLHHNDYLCHGELATWPGPKTTVTTPLMDQPLGSYPALDEPTAMAVLEAAKSAWCYGTGHWARTSMGERIERMEQFLAAMRAQRETVSQLIMWEISKSFADAQKEFDRTIRYIESTLETVKEMDRDAARLVQKEGYIAQIRRMPLGVGLCMGPYNYPLNETFATLIPAIIMGNAVVLKPPRLGVLLYRPLLEAFAQCFPPGVVNTVYGDGPVVASPLMRSGDVDVLAFIGTSHTADLLRSQHPRPHRLKAALGLEAKDAAIVLPDADLEVTVTEIIKGALSFNGQRCTAIKMVLVHRTIRDRFLERLCEAVDALAFGMPWEDHVLVTPLPEPARVQAMQSYLEDAENHGGRICNRYGGKTKHTFFYPAVVFPVTPAMRLYHEEQFGPIIPVVEYDAINEALDVVIHSPYGQQASVFGQDPVIVGQVVDALANQVCRINLNAECQRGPDTFPFNGRKDSAEGTLSVYDALRTFSIRAMAATPRTEANMALLRAILAERSSNFISTDYLF
jgi:glyceraldehyde-3-phosphate dehydrogenase (NADP+)